MISRNTKKNEEKTSSCLIFCRKETPFISILMSIYTNIKVKGKKPNKYLYYLPTLYGRKQNKEEKRPSLNFSKLRDSILKYSILAFARINVLTVSTARLLLDTVEGKKILKYI